MPMRWRRQRQTQLFVSARLLTRWSGVSPLRARSLGRLPWAAFGSVESLRSDAVGVLRRLRGPRPHLSAERRVPAVGPNASPSRALADAIEKAG